MNWKLFGVVFVSIVTALLLIPLLWWFAGMPGLAWIVALTTIVLASLIVTGPLAVAKAALDALEEHLSKPIVIQLDPRDGMLDVAVNRESQETMADFEVTWGKMWKSTNTLVPVYIVLHFDKESMTARGTWFGVDPPHVPLRNRWILHDMYADLEEEAAKATRLEAVTRTLARRGAEAHQRKTMEDFDATTKPHGEEFTKVIEEFEEQLLPEENPEEDVVDDDREEDVGDDLDGGPAEETEVGALPPGEETAVPDGGRDE